MFLSKLILCLILPGLLLLQKSDPVGEKNIKIIALVSFNVDSKHIPNTSSEPKVGDGGYFRHLRKIF